MTIAQKSAVLLGIDYEAHSALLDMLSDAAAEEVKAYCNIAEIPAG